MGGLSKKAFQYEKITAEENIPSLIVDAGSLLFKRTKLSKKRAEQEKITALGIVESYSRIGYDAVGIAREDLIAGLDFFKKISEASAFPWVSANLIDTLTNKALFTPSLLVQKGDITIGITSLTDTALYTAFKEEDHAAVLPWQKMLPTLIEELKEKSDLIILLSNLPVKDNRAITQAYPHIDIIIQAGITVGNQPPRFFNKTLICQTGKQGKQIGIMNINWQNSPWGSKKADQLDKSIKSLDRLSWQLGKFDKYKEPLVDLKGKPDQLANYQKLLLKKNKVVQEIERLSAANSQKKCEKIPSSYKNRFISIQTTLPDHKDIVAIVEKTKQEINQLGQKQIAQKNTIESPYIGSESCTSCHVYQGASWQKSRHAKAYTTLVNKNQQFNLDCLPCHITGSGDLDKGDAVNLSKNLQAVGCENCHGPGRQHAQMPQNMGLASQVSASTCLKCHTEDHDDSFDFANDVKKLKCGKQ